MPHKIWAVGEEVQAADFNTYLQNQTVPQFPNTASRDQWVAPPKGALAVTTDTNSVWQYTGAAWGRFYPHGEAPRARVYRTTEQGFGSSAQTVHLFNTVRWNKGPLWSAAANSRLTVPPGWSGLYAIGAGVRYTANSVGMRQLSLRRNGSSQIAVQAGQAANLSDQEVSTHYELNAGDYVEVMVYQSSGVSLSSEPNLNAAPEFWATWLAPLAT